MAQLCQSLVALRCCGRGIRHYNYNHFNHSLRYIVQYFLLKKSVRTFNLWTTFVFLLLTHFRAKSFAELYLLHSPSIEPIFHRHWSYFAINQKTFLRPPHCQGNCERVKMVAGAFLRPSVGKKASRNAINYFSNFTSDKILGNAKSDKNWDGRKEEIRRTPFSFFPSFLLIHLLTDGCCWA